jgi:hypothetical protein
MRSRTLFAGALAAVSIAFSGPVSAAAIDLSAEVNANLNTYFDGFVYPPNGGPITIGGINFNLNALPGGGTGVIQTDASSTTPFNIPIGQFGVTTVYTISNSAFGTAGFTAGQLTFHGSGGDTFTYILLEGDNIRDHATTGFNIIAPNIFATHDLGPVIGSMCSRFCYPPFLPPRRSRVWTSPMSVIPSQAMGRLSWQRSPLALSVASPNPPLGR